MKRLLRTAQPNLHGWLVLSEGDKPLTAKEINLKLSIIWNTRHSHGG